MESKITIEDLLDLVKIYDEDAITIIEKAYNYIMVNIDQRK